MLTKENTQCIKGIGILMVVISHLMYTYPMPEAIVKTLSPLGYLGVSLFLLVSGYGCRISFEKSNYKIGSFLYKRVKTIIKLLIPITLIFVFLSMIIYHHSYEVADIILNMLGFSNSIGKLTWYILFQYMWYFVLATTTNKKGQTVVQLMIASLFVYVLSVLVNTESPNFKMWGLNIFSFPVGVCLALYRDRIKNYFNEKRVSIKIISLSGILFLFLFIACYFILHNPSNLFVQNLMKSTIAAVFCSTIVFIAAAGYRLFGARGSRILEHIGGISFEVYLIHGYWIFTMQEFFEPKSIGKVMIWIAIVFLSAEMLNYIKRSIEKIKLR